MKSKSILRFCGLFLVSISFIIALNPAGDVMNSAAPMDILHGEYSFDADSFSTSSYRPTWAALWELSDVDLQNEEFQVTFFPPKYCHAVYICPVKKVDFAQKNFQTEEGMCEDAYVKFYPHAKKMMLKVDKQTPEVIKYWMSIKLEFIVSDTGDISVIAFDNELETFEEYENETKNPKKVSLWTLKPNTHQLLILTNSRMCQVNKLGAAYYPFFKKSIQNDQSNPPIYPEWLRSGPSSMKSDALFTTHLELPNAADLLAPLKDLQWNNNGVIGGYKHKCTETSRTGANVDPAEVMTRISALSNSVEANTGSFPAGYVNELVVKTNNCHWIRLWFSDPLTGMDKYKNAKTSEFLTIFLNEGFVIGPESDIAHELPDATYVDRITIRAFPEDPYKNMIEVGYGNFMNEPIFREYFKMPHVDKNQFNVHLIRAPGCRAKYFVNTRKKTFGPKNEAVLPNRWEIPEECTLSTFE